jgi:hypothetical protein
LDHFSRFQKNWQYNTSAVEWQEFRKVNLYVAHLTFHGPIGLPYESQSQISLILIEALSLEMRLSSLSGIVRCQAASVIKHLSLLVIVFTIFLAFSTSLELELGKLSVFTRGARL